MLPPWLHAEQVGFQPQNTTFSKRIKDTRKSIVMIRLCFQGLCRKTCVFWMFSAERTDWVGRGDLTAKREKAAAASTKIICSQYAWKSNGLQIQ